MNRNKGNGKSDNWLSVLADSVADGTPVDWDQQERQHPEFVQKLRMLRDIQSVGRMCSSEGALAATSRPTPRADALSRRLDSDSTGLRNSVDSGRRTRPNDRAEVSADLASHLSTWGHLSFLEKIGEGSFGEVYRAYDSALDKEVALKLLRSDQLAGKPSPERLLKEARSLAQVQHPNVVTVHGADVHDGVVGIWTDLLHGRTLEGCLECSGAFGANEATLIGIELCAALSAIHAAGLVHGDVKTTNVMREDGGHIVLMDFGTVRREVPNVFSETGAQGTPLAMAPELLLEEARPTPASDLYGLGVLMYRLVTRDFPVHASSMKELKEKHRRGKTPRLRDRRPDISPLFARVVDKALSPDPADRYATFGDMERALCEAVCVQPAVEKPAMNWRGVPRLAAACVALAAALWVVVHYFPASDLQVQTAFYKNQGNVAEIVDVSKEIKLRAGDSLFMKFESDDDVHLYVLNESKQEFGEVYTLFPADFSVNPIRAGVTRRLPEDPLQYWEFDGESSETLLIVASRQPREVLEERIATEFHDGSEPELMMAENETTEQTTDPEATATAGRRTSTESDVAAGTGIQPEAGADAGQVDVSELVLDPNKVAELGLRRLTVSGIDPTKTSTLEALAARIREEMKSSKDVWCQVVRIEP